MGQRLKSLYQCSAGIRSFLRANPGSRPARAKFTVTFISAAILGLTLTAQRKNSAFQLHIHRASSAISIDGAMQERAWSEADSASNFFMVLPMDTSRARVPTTVRMSYDEQNLYILAICYLVGKAPFMVESLRRDFIFGK